jgi:hypothetical protein
MTNLVSAFDAAAGPPAAAAAPAVEAPECSVSIGAVLPPLDATSKLPIKAHELRGVCALLDVVSLPVRLWKYDAEGWKHSKFLIDEIKRALPRGKKQMANRTIPLAIILDAKDMTERLIVINYWVSLDAIKKERAISNWKRVYERLTVSNKRVPPAQRYTGCCSSRQDLDEHAENSRSHHLAQRPHERNQSNGIATAKNLSSKPIRSKTAMVEHNVFQLLNMTEVDARKKLKFEAILTITRNVSTPSKPTNYSDQDVYLSYTKMIVLARNKAALVDAFGQQWVEEKEGDQHTVLWYADENQTTYSDNNRRKRQRDRVQSAEQTRNDSSHSESIVSPGDF